MLATATSPDPGALAAKVRALLDPRAAWCCPAACCGTAHRWRRHRAHGGAGGSPASRARTRAARGSRRSIAPSTNSGRRLPARDPCRAAPSCRRPRRRRRGCRRSRRARSSRPSGESHPRPRPPPPRPSSRRGGLPRRGIEGEAARSRHPARPGHGPRRHRATGVGRRRDRRRDRAGAARLRIAQCRHTAQHSRPELRRALATALEARQDGMLDACGFGLLGHALSSLGRYDDAADAYVAASKLAPDDPYVRHLAAAAGRFEAGERAPPDYVRALFNSYADRFDQHLIHLRYRIPGLLRGVLARHAAAPGPVLDLGCGTGLLAVACQDVVHGDWTGVDLSPRMLAAAREKALYRELHEADLTAYLADEERTFPLILAGDVLCYFGPLAPILKAVQSHLTPDGRFVLTVGTARLRIRCGAPGSYGTLRPLGGSPPHCRRERQPADTCPSTRRCSGTTATPRSGVRGCTRAAA